MFKYAYTLLFFGGQCNYFEYPASLGFVLSDLLTLISLEAPVTCITFICSIFLLAI